MNTLNLISFFVLGFTSGVLFCFFTLALPAIRKAQEVRRLVLQGLESHLDSLKRMAKTMGIVLPVEPVVFTKEKDGKIVSPIQINKKETNN